MFSRLAISKYLMAVLVVWVIIFSFYENNVNVLQGHWHFFILGLLGAIVANSTGAGGGIVFIPAFDSLGIEGASALGTSIAIQCFGMTAGAVAWLTSSGLVRAGSAHIHILLRKLLLHCGFVTVVGMLFGQIVFGMPDPGRMLIIFKLFSVVFGLVILLLALFGSQSTHTNYVLHKIDYIAILSACFIGAVITAWISIGVGEFVAIAILLRRFPTMVAICIGVCMSSISVLTGVWHHLQLHNIDYDVLLFAAPAALIGGGVAHLLSQKLGPARLKIFFATWILTTGLVL